MVCTWNNSVGWLWIQKKISFAFSFRQVWRYQVVNIAIQYMMQFYGILLHSFCWNVPIYVCTQCRQVCSIENQLFLFYEFIVNYFGFFCLCRGNKFDIIISIGGWITSIKYTVFSYYIIAIIFHTKCLAPPYLHFQVKSSH